MHGSPDRHAHTVQATPDRPAPMLAFWARSRAVCRGEERAHEETDA